MQLSISGPLDWLVALIALYGAILSTVLAAKDFIRDKRRIKVTCHIALASAPKLVGNILVPAPEKEIYEFVEIKAVNIGHRPVEITSAGLHLSNGKFITQLTSKMGPQPLPKKLNDGESVFINFDYDELVKGLKKQGDSNIFFTSAFVSDAEGREYRSKLPRIFREKGLAKDTV